MTDIERLVIIENKLNKLHQEEKELKKKLHPIMDKISKLICEKKALLRKTLVGKYINHIQGFGGGSFNDNYIHILSTNDGNTAIVEKITFMKIKANKDTTRTYGYNYIPEEEMDLMFIDPKGLGNNSSEITKEEFHKMKTLCIKEIQ